MHHHAFINPPRVDDVSGQSVSSLVSTNPPPPQSAYGRPPQGPPNGPRDFPPRGGFPSGKDLHHFEQDYQDAGGGMPLESEDYLSSLGRAPADDDRSYIFGQQVPPLSLSLFVYLSL
jgi:hypothetical protein